MKKALRLVILTVALLLGVDLALAQGGARDAGYLYLSPVPGAPYVSAQTRYVLVRFENVTPSEVTNLTTSFITVTGANSGPHSGVTHVASDGRTVIFAMSVDFSQNELVTVTLNPELDGGAGGVLEPYQYQFMITAPMPGPLPAPVIASPVPVPTGDPGVEGGPSDGPGQGPEAAAGNAATAAVIKPNGVSVPSDFPAVVITVNSNPSPGYLFLETGVSAAPYTMILDNYGSPIWYRRGAMTDFKIQKNGIITWNTDNAAGFSAFDENFNYIQTYLAVNGYRTDLHEMKVLEDGSYLMLGYRVNKVDMSQYVPGGSTSASVTEGVIQEFTAAGELIFQWRAWDNYDVRLSYQIPLSVADFPHMNAVAVDEDGHLLVSARHLSEVTKINRDTGEIIWRLSGANSSFTFVNDPFNGTSFQHDISALGNGRYMVFDNGENHVPQVSRAVEYQLDLTNMTATMIWQFRDTPDKYAYACGTAQRLPTGNTLINFVRPQYPKAIEVDMSGAKRFEVSLAPSGDACRAFRFPWNGVVAVPYLIAEPQQDNITLIFNKFGDTNVSYYRIYGGTSPQPTTLMATSTTTLKRLANLENGRRYYFRVTAVDRQGVESGYSNEENLTVNIIKAGEQMVLNGDFSQGMNSWTWAVSGGASAQWQVSNGLSYFDIANGGSAVASLQLRQAGKPLIQGKKYVFEFDAWAQGPRYIEAKVGQTASPYADYSRIGLTYLTPTPTHYRYEFTMPAASDFNSSVMFNLGTSTFDVFLDNVSLVNPLPVANGQTITLDEDTSASFVLTAGNSGSENLTFEVTSLPAHGMLDGTAPNQTYTPVSNYFGPDEFTFKVNDGLLDSEPATVSITVKPVNDPPVAKISVAPLVEVPGITNLLVLTPPCTNAVVVLDGSSSSDVEEDPLHYSWFLGDSTNSSATGVVAVVTLPVGTNTVTLVVSDGAATGTASVDIEVLTVRQAIQRLLIVPVQDSSLPCGNKLWLNVTLLAAKGALQRGHLIVAIHWLESFQHEVRTLVAPRDAALAERLLAGASAIVDVVNDCVTCVRPPWKWGRLFCHADGRVRMQFAAPHGPVYIIEASTDMVHWEKIGVARDCGAGEFEFEDTQAGRLPQRFYRIVAPWWRAW